MNTVNEEMVSLADLKEGDEIIASHKGIVTSVNVNTGHVLLKDGARIRVTRGKGWEAVGDKAILFNLKRTKKAASFAAGQVWEDMYGVRYVIVNGHKLKAYTFSDILVLIEDLAKKPGLKMVFGGK